jgi:hypothetical protein
MILSLHIEGELRKQPCFRVLSLHILGETGRMWILKTQHLGWVTALLKFIGI